MADPDWNTFDPGFDHGQVELRPANIDGVFSASKISDTAAGLVQAPNVTGQIGSESFDWNALKVSKGVDVRSANLRGQLGADNFDWSSVDPEGTMVLKPNLPTNLDSSAFDGIDLAAMGADVRTANCDGVIGDAEFLKLVNKQMTPLTPVQQMWRFAMLPLAIGVPAGLAKPLMAVAPTQYGAPVAALLAVLGLLATWAVLKKVIMVKQGELCFAQFFENGATHVLQAGVQLVASFGTTTKFFDVKEDQMQFGTVSFVRVRPGFVGIATDNGKPVLLLPGQHLYNNANFALGRLVSVTEQYVANGPMHLIRVNQGQLGLVSINKRPIILESGMHFVFNPGFEMKKSGGEGFSLGPAYSSVNEQLITNGPVSIIRIKPGNVGLATSSKQPVLLGAGLHYIHDPSFEWIGEKDVSACHIQNGATRTGSPTRMTHA